MRFHAVFTAFGNGPVKGHDVLVTGKGGFKLQARHDEMSQPRTLHLGQHAGVAMYESTYSVCTENGAQTIKTDALFSGSATD